MHIDNSTIALVFLLAGIFISWIIDLVSWALSKLWYMCRPKETLGEMVAYGTHFKSHDEYQKRALAFHSWAFKEVSEGLVVVSIELSSEEFEPCKMDYQNEDPMEVPGIVYAWAIKTWCEGKEVVSMESDVGFSEDESVLGYAVEFCPSEFKPPVLTVRANQAA